MSENGAPSSSRFISVVALLIMAPGILVACIFKAPDQLGLAFEVWVTVCGGVYVGRKWLGPPRNGSSSSTSTTDSTTTTSRQSSPGMPTP